MATPALPPGFTLDAPQAAAPPLPPGFTLDQPSAAPAAAPAATPTDPRARVGNAIVQLGADAVGGAELLGKAATGAVAAIPAGLAYGGAAVGKAFGADVNPSEVMGRVQNYLTWQPRSESGKAGEKLIADTVRPAAQYITSKADRAASAVGKVSPFAEGMMREAPSAFQAATGVLPLASAAKLVMSALRTPEIMTPEAAARLTPQEAAAAPQREAIAAGKGLGLKFTPQQEGRSTGSVVQGLTGSAKLERSLSKDNAQVINAKAAKQIGLPENMPVTRQTIEQARAKPNKAYDEVGKLGAVQTDDAWRAEIAGIGDRSGNKSFPEDTSAAVQTLKGIYANKKGFDAADAVSKVRSLRSDAFANIALREPEKQALGRAQLQIADALDNQLERHAQSLGQEDLVQRYRDARAQLATIHVVRRALKGSNVSARALSAQQERGVKLTGDLKTIADSYDVADRSLQDLGKIRDNSPFGVVDLFVGAGAALHNPALAAAAAARPATRAILASDAYQRGGIQPRTPTGNALRPKAKNALSQETPARARQGRR